MSHIIEESDWFSNNESYNENEDDGCEFANDILCSIEASRPFGIIWDVDKMKEFLEKRGYNVVPLDTDPEDYIVYKDTDDLIPDLPNIDEVFASEIQSILLKWLIKLDADN
jgi:hypothetical protein